MNIFLTSLLLFFALGVGLYVFVNVRPATLVRAIRSFIIAFAALAGLGLFFSGRIGLAIFIISAAIMMLRATRFGSAGRVGSFGTAHAPHSGQGQTGGTSEIVTDMLSMTLDHQTGDLDGDVLQGSFKGRPLGSLGLQDLLQLLMECQRDDPRSVPLLETFLDRNQPDWRDYVADAQSSGADDAGPTSKTAMDKATACSILNISLNATDDEIKEAHRALMNKLHPDHGGSSYLAAQLNLAKEVLLRR